MIEIWITLAAILVLLVLSAFFSGSETALTAVSRARMHALEVEGNGNAQQVNRILARPERIIGTVLIGNNLVNILASALTTSMLIRLFGDVGVAYATVIMTVIVVVFSEVLPKTYALAYADRISLAVAPVMVKLIALFHPLTTATHFVVKCVFRATPTTKDDQADILAAQEELRGTIALGEQGGAVERTDAEMLGGVLDLNDLQVIDIMVHRTKMDTLDVNWPARQIVNEVLAGQYSRLPVWREQPENIVGVLHTKDLLAALARAGWDPDGVDISSILVSPWFVPDTTSLKEQLSQFLARKQQMALVVDEYGEVQGLVTLEDIIEEIVGQISDEHDTHETQIRAQPDGSVSVEGTLPIRDLNRAMGWTLPDDEATTVAGLIMHEAQMIPEIGQAFTFYGYRFEIIRKHRNRVTGVRVRPLGTGKPADAAAGTPKT
ncbi:MAG: HlyC/CorC family transporter [Hyphomicrobiaceae bacterium]